MTEHVVKCTAKDRYKQIAASNLNGIDYVEVVTLKPSGVYLVVYFFKDLADFQQLDAANVRIEGGVKVKNIRVAWAMPYSSLTDSFVKSGIGSCIDVADGSVGNILVVCPSCEGDFSAYTLRVVCSLSSNAPPAGFDLMLSSIDFSFKVNSPSKFDCRSFSGSSQEVLQEPLIDYLSKDYDSFRHLMLSRLALLMPSWKERNVADVGIMITEALAYVGDYLSYYQDAVATEAYLGTCRSRVSVKRHARLLDYYVHSGCNARVWLCVQTDLTGTDEAVCVIPKGTKFLTGIGDGDLIVDEVDLESELSQGIKVFEAMHDLKRLYKRHNTINFYTWGNASYCLPKGSIQASLYDGIVQAGDGVDGLESRLLCLEPGDVLIFEETHSCKGVAEDTDFSHRYAVRLTHVSLAKDELVDPAVYVVNVAWDLEDALPFSLCLRKDSKDVAVAHGNVLLADYGLSLKAERLVDPEFRVNFRPHLSRGPLTFRGPFDISASASSVFDYDLQDVIADIYLRQLSVPKNEFDTISETDWLPGVWMPQQDLLSSNKFRPDFVVETENDGSVALRFGDGVYGLNPQGAAGDAPDLFYAFYRVGNGPEGNVGADSIKRVVSSSSVLAGSIIGVRNPLPARGGVNPETIAMVRQNAPEAAKVNERAVTNVDYADIVKRKCREIQSAAALTRWTGSWYTVYVMVDRFGRKPIDEAFKLKIQNILNKHRLSGYDIEVCGPQYVPLEIEVTVTVSPDSLCEEVEKMLLDIFSNRILPNGLKGFFHPDNFTFGQPLLLRSIRDVISQVDGVVSFSVTKFARVDKEDDGGAALNDGILIFGPYEVILLDNDANYPENGRIAFTMEGGR
jgi:hypothetical protein